MGFEFEGLDELQNQFKQMAESAKELDGTNEVAFTDLFTYSFMRNHTNFTSFDEFLSAGKFIVNSQRDFDEIPRQELDSHVNKNTDFSSWEEMFNTSYEEYIFETLGF